MSADCALPRPVRLAYAVRWSDPWERCPRNRQPAEAAGCISGAKPARKGVAPNPCHFAPLYASPILATGGFRPGSAAPVRVAMQPRGEAMSEKAREFMFYSPSWTVDFMALSADERGILISLCVEMLNRNGPVPLADLDRPWIYKRIYGCTRAKFHRALDRLEKFNLVRIVDGKIVHDRCVEMIADARRRLARKDVPRKDIFERDGYRCSYCGTTDGPFECDHIMPVSRGGTNDNSNLTTACVSCNRDKRAMTVDEWRGKSGTAS